MHFISMKARYIAGCAAAMALGTSTIALAQTADTTSELETVVVSSTRLQNAGFDAPTPTQVLSSTDIAQIAQPNIFNAIIMLPALQGSTGQTYETGSTSTGLQGLSSFSLRGFSPLRTLTLIDGERIVAANDNGVVDVSLLPQMLIQRVDVVTGGASASWGSDAVAGVVNIVTDKKFEGFKADASYGQSAYNDNKTPSVKMAAGTAFLGGRAHIEVAGEYSNDEGIIASGSPPNAFGCGTMLGGRTINACTGAINFGSPGATAAASALYGTSLPQITPVPNFQNTGQTMYGMITNGALQGTAFGGNGQPYQFNFAGGAVPARAGNNAIVAGTGFCSGGNCESTPAQPGDLTNTSDPPTLYQPVLRDTFFMRLSFDLTPTSEIFATFNYGSSISNSEPTAAFGRTANLTIGCNNAYLPASVAAACVTNYAGSANSTYPTGFMDYGVFAPFTNYENVNNDRTTRRFVLGGDGAFQVMGKDWTWDTYAEYGETQSNLRITNMPLLPNFYAAINAVAGTGAGGNGIPVGQIGCAEAAARAAGCEPYNIIGNQNNTAGAGNYIIPPQGPYYDMFMRQEAFGATLNAKLFADWAGDVSTAIGVDYRLENYHVTTDPYGNGDVLPASDVYTAAYPPDPAMCNCNGFNTSTDPVGGGAWFAGNYHEGRGQYTVEEVFVEAGVPLYKSVGWGALDADLGARFEHYSQSGNWTTWKLGLVWDTPAPGVRIRAIESEDLRAPNLSEIDTPPTTINGGGNNPFLNNATFEANQITQGNPLLRPETSRTDEVGIVFQPEYVPGLRASADYYHINVLHVIQSSLSGQTIINECFAGVTVYCGQNFLPTANGESIATCGCNPIALISQLNNQATIVTTGVDLEADYQFKLDNWGIPGNFAIRALGTKTYQWRICPGLPPGVAGNICVNDAGALGNFSTSTTYNAIGGTVPTWKTVFAEDYSNTWGTFTLYQRWFNAGSIQNNFIQCNPGSCPPVANENYPTINFNHMPGAIYWDAGASLNVGPHAEVYAKVNNIANNLSPANSATFNITLYDDIGRMYYAGFRMHF
jgi:iron complex outermembrane recepter protein